MSSSDRPSEKYSWSFFSDRSSNGSTAMDFFGAVLAGALATACVAGTLAAAAGRCSQPACQARKPPTRITAVAPMSARGV